ncbi:PilZ domain-containing protein [Pyxidicoccus parkwayensis]|uniref:PilZ domain-containing protein n=1 Tax=Pyxidicoccus parkwayensis TaxID=2813578 RepID=UPI001F51456E|nr:PilZ domain-containing protein [Pyxidicoccus parkwaysis]
MSVNDSPSDRRRFPRLAAPLYARPARLRRVDWQQQQVLDASLGGVRIYADEKFSEKIPLELDLFLKDGTELSCVARVAWMKELPAGAVARYEVGLAFTDASPAMLDQLKTVLIPEDEGSADSP